MLIIIDLSYIMYNDLWKWNKWNEIDLKKNSMIWVRKRTIPTERPPLVGEVITNLCG
jgi:hypothetical protein